MADKNRPVHQVRIGRVKAAVFENGDDAPCKVQFTALYKNEEDKWRGSSSFAREDLPLLIKVADQVHSYLYQQNEQQEQKRFFRRVLRFLEADHAPPASPRNSLVPLEILSSLSKLNLVTASLPAC